MASKIDVEPSGDAFNAITMEEDQLTQAHFLLGQWREIYEQSAGKGKVGNCIGGMIFQWSDGWWKFGQESRLDIHDTHAYALRGIAIIVMLLGLVLFLPVPLPVLGVPVVATLIGLLVGAAVANAQKRL